MWPCARLLFVSPTGRNCVARNDAEICSSPCPRFLHFVHRPCEERFLCGIDDHICSYGSILRSDYSHDHALVTTLVTVAAHPSSFTPVQPLQNKGCAFNHTFCRDCLQGSGAWANDCVHSQSVDVLVYDISGPRPPLPSPRRRYVQGQIEQGRVPQCPRHAECK